MGATAASGSSTGKTHYGNYTKNIESNAGRPESHGSRPIGGYEG
jgi:hypothetical protein